jgi:hypothetical protein
MATEKFDTERGGKDRKGDIDQVVADQDRAQQTIRPIEQSLQIGGLGNSLAGQVLDPQAIHRHQCRFRAGKERREDEQQPQSGQLQPLFSRKLHEPPILLNSWGLYQRRR